MELNLDELDLITDNGMLVAAAAKRWQNEKSDIRELDDGAAANGENWALKEATYSELIFLKTRWNMDKIAPGEAAETFIKLIGDLHYFDKNAGDLYVASFVGRALHTFEQIAFSNADS